MAPYPQPPALPPGYPPPGYPPQPQARPPPPVPFAPYETFGAACNYYGLRLAKRRADPT